MRLRQWLVAMDWAPVISIDPHSAPSVTDPDLQGKASSFDDFLTTIRSADLEEQVEIHRAFSGEVAAKWNRKIRMLWIDGDHTYNGAKADSIFSLRTWPRVQRLRFTIPSVRTLTVLFGSLWKIFSDQITLDQQASVTRWDGRSTAPGRGELQETTEKSGAKSGAIDSIRNQRKEDARNQ